MVCLHNFFLSIDIYRKLIGNLLPLMLELTHISHTDSLKKEAREKSKSIWETQIRDFGHIFLSLERQITTLCNKFKQHTHMGPEQKKISCSPNGRK